MEGHTSYLNALAFSPDETLLASAESDFLLSLDTVPSVYVWEVKTGKILQVFSVKFLSHWPQPAYIKVKIIMALAFSSDNTLIACANSDATIRIWEVATGRELTILLGPEYYSNSIRFIDVDNKLLVASAYNNGELWLWDVNKSEAIIKMRTNLSFRNNNCLMYNPDSQTLAISDADKNNFTYNIKLLDINNGEMKGVLSGHTGLIEAIAINASGELTATSDTDKAINIWNTKTGESYKKLRDKSGYVRSMNFSQNGTKLIGWSWNAKSYASSVKWWSVTTGRLLKVQPVSNKPFSDEPVSIATISPNANFIASGAGSQLFLQNLEYQFSL